MRTRDLALLADALPKPRLEQLDNGLTVALLDRPAPVVSTALAYRAGRRHDPPGHGGTAHFLEHMMFRGAARFGPGAVDRATRRAGGSNNAFTTHDATVYELAFGRDRWAVALDIEADRMRALLLDPDSVDRERRVIEEELAMAEDDPWDALEQAVFRALFPRHAYGRPVLGRRADLRRTDSDDLDEFHRRRYRPANAVLAIAGADPADALARTRDVFAAVPPRPPQAPGGPRRRRAARSGRRPRSSRRLTRYAGETARLMIGLPAPAGDDPQLPQVDLLLAVLATGRSSRLQRSLVDGGLCAFVGAQVAAMRERGAALLTAELLPGTVPQQVEAMLLAALDDLAKAPPKRAEIARVRRMMVADWIFAHERVHQQAVATAMAVGLFDAGHPLRQAGRLLAAGQDALADAGRRWLDPARGSVIGWSLPLSDAS